jgi:permease for cytosine/purines
MGHGCSTPLLSTHINSKYSLSAPTYFCPHYHQTLAMGQRFSLSGSRLQALARPSTWILEPEASTFAESSSWSNEDMDPVPPHKRTWTMLNYVTFWISCAVNVTTWQLGSSMLVIGLSWYIYSIAVCRSPSLIDGPQAAGTTSYFLRTFHPWGHHSADWYHRCTAPRTLHRPRSFIIRVLVQLFLRH